MMIDRRKLLIGAAAMGCAQAAGQSITPQIGGGISSGFDGGVSGGVKTGVNWTAEGDSITSGLGGVPSYPYVALQSMPGGGSFSFAVANTDGSATITSVGKVRCLDIGTPGLGIATMNSSYSTRAGAKFDSSKRLNVLSIMGGTNDIAGGDTAQNVYLNLRAVVRQARTQGYQRIVIGTITARDDDAVTPGTFWTTKIVPVNAFIRTYAFNDLDADFLMDFGNDPQFSPNTAADNLTLYLSDKLHPNVAGEAAMGAIALTPMSSAMAGPGTRTAGAATFFDVDIGPAIALSNGNRTALSSSNGPRSVRSIPSIQGGNVYFEMSVDTSLQQQVGLANNKIQFAGGGGANLQSTVNTVGWGTDFSGNNLLKYNGTTLATIGTLSATNIIQGAVRYADKLLFMRVAGGNWNGNASADPTTGVGGVSIAAMMALNDYSGKLFPAACSIQTGAQFTSNFAAAQMTGPVPSGFSTFA